MSEGQPSSDSGESGLLSNPQALRERLERIEQELEQKQKDLMLAAQIGSHLVEENAALKEEVQSFRMKLEVTVRELATHRSNSTVLETKCHDLETRLGMRTNEFNLVTAQLNQALAKMQELDSRFISTQRKMNQQQEYLDTVETLRRQLDQATANALAARQREAAHEARIRELEDNISELNAHIRRTEARLSEQVPVDVAKMEELQRDNDRLRSEVQRKAERTTTLEKDMADMEQTLSHLKEVSNQVNQAHDEIAYLKKQLDLKSKLLEQANENLRLAAAAAARAKETTSLSRELAESSSSASMTNSVEDLSSLPMEGIPISPSGTSAEADLKQTRPIFHSPTSSDSNTPRSVPPTPFGSYVSDSPMALGYDPSAAFLEQQQKLNELNRKLEETANLLAEKSEEQLKLQDLNRQLQQTATLLQAKSEQLQVQQQASPDLNRAKKEGYMTKEGAFVKSWKRRFFFMESDALYYSSDAKTRFVTRGAIELKNARIADGNVQNRPSSFSILTPARTYFLQCDSEEEKMDWLEALRVRIAQLNNMQPPPPSMVPPV